MAFFALTCRNQTVTLSNTVGEHLTMLLQKIVLQEASRGALNHVSGSLEVLNVTPKFLQEL